MSAVTPVACRSGWKRLQVDSRFVDSLRTHLACQGFPAVRVESDALEVLYPGDACSLEAAAELDLWRASHGDGVPVQLQGMPMWSR